MKQATNIVDRFVKNLVSFGDCILWKGGLNNSGYGFIHGRTITISVHRFAYELATGIELPDNLEPDHKCKRKNCVQIEHLEIKTHRQNCRDNWTHCKRGHELTLNNILIEKKTGKRRCKICTQAKQAYHNMVRSK